MKKVLYYHGETKEGNRFTIAGRYVNRDANAEIRLGISLCSKNDNFCKATGRIKAEGRSFANPGHTKGIIIHGMYDYDFYKDKETLLNWFVEEKVDAFLEVAKQFDNMPIYDVRTAFNLNRS